MTFLHADTKSKGHGCVPMGPVCNLPLPSLAKPSQPRKEEVEAKLTDPRSFHTSA